MSGMKRLNSRLVGIDQGEVVLFSEYESGGTMWTGEGERTRRQAVRFCERYRSPPVVHCALSMWDIDSQTNARVEVITEAITATDFTVVFRTWADTHIARVRVCWMAIGELPDDEDWDLY